MCDTQKMLTVAEDMFKDEGMAVSIGTRHSHTKHPNEADVTILLGGRIEFNSFLHRRDMVDVMLHYNLYVKLLDNGRYQAGVHDTKGYIEKDKPTTAITEMAYFLICQPTSVLG